MANPEHVKLLRQGFKAWNEWKNKENYHPPDLTGADLSKCDLTHADLRGLNLEKAVLRETRLGEGSLLWNVNLANADLYKADFRGADLQDASFNGADIFQADLRETNLQGADLSGAKGGLLSRQLAGANLTGAKLPEPLAKLYENLSSVKEISDNAQKLFLALLAGCLYSWLTIATTNDVDLITNRASSPLPIIQTAIPIVGFYVVAPLILLCIYFYFHFYLQKLWDELGSLPAIFVDGRPLHARADPWLLNDLVQSHVLKLREGRPFLSYFQEWISILLAWWIVPITLMFFWVRFLRRQDVGWTVFHALLLALAIVSAIRLYRLGMGTLRGDDRMVFTWKAVARRKDTYTGISWAIVPVIVLMIFSLGSIFGTPADGTTSPRTWVPTILQWGGAGSFAQLQNADVSLKPADWTGKKDEELDRVKGAIVQRGNLRNVNARDAFLVNARLQGSDMRGAILVGADMRQADLGQADLTAADLIYAHLQKTEFVNALLNNAILYGVELNGADLSDVHLRFADLRAANLSGVVLHGADLTGTRLFHTKLRYADLRFAKGLTKAQIVESTDWNQAFFDHEMLRQLELSPDHNVKLESQRQAEDLQKPAGKAEQTKTDRPRD